ncbi:glycosyltransferase family 2 protein [Empedobacter falsenii]
MNKPLISVIVPCYNQAQYMDECLQSVLDQTYHNWECIMVNDGSPDHTEEVALQWTEKDSRFIYLKKENGGLSSARNAGIEIAKGEWILPLDCDDKIGNRYLELAEKEFDKDYAIIYCEAKKFGLVNENWLLKDFSIENIILSNIIFCSAFFKKTDWEIVKGYDSGFKYGLEDWDYWMSLLEYTNGNVYRINEVLFYYRIKEVSMIKELDSFKTITMQNLMYTKHEEFITKHKGSYYQILYELEREKNINHKIINSLKYKIIQKISKFFKF